jgi:hypothetical protein
MSLEKVISVDKIEVLENGCVQVRTLTAVMEDGVQIGGTFHRHVVTPGQDYSQECERVKAICAATHTSEVIAAYKTDIAA